ncbi:Tat pathway signal sequence [Mycena venus]|uniref:Tat pathway signal sequence n=1 Tax=Mycena venus TaxID=2733690 RepID=A0A8H6Y2F2_9AGAR|nr:Tat pathway signal sequence [Mycena venus]
MAPYHPLSSDDEVTSFLPKSRDEFSHRPNLKSCRELRGARSWIIGVSSCLNFILVVALVVSTRPLELPQYSSSVLYSPAQDAISYSLTLFSHSDATIDSTFRGAGPDVDKAWQELYGFGPSILTEDEAKKLLNSTDPILVADQETHSVVLAVFHDLHCLNLARMSLYPDHYNSPALKAILTPHHLGHCIEMLRQSIQCISDISPLPARTGHYTNGLLYNYKANIPHMCRDFGKVKEWASARTGTDEFEKAYLTRHIWGSPPSQ